VSHLCQVLGNALGGTISRIEVINGEFLAQANMESHTMDMCSAQFCLTEGTPPMTEPLHSELGYLGTAAMARQISGFAGFLFVDDTDFIASAESQQFLPTSYGSPSSCCSRMAWQLMHLGWCIETRKVLMEYGRFYLDRWTMDICYCGGEPWCYHSP
jgi:hypothetical protein